MTAFIIAAVLLTVFILAVIARPFLFKRVERQELSMERLNTGILHDEVAALEREHAAGALNAEEFAAARDDVHRRLLEETGADATPARPASRALFTLVPIALALPLVAIALYLVLGTPGAMTNPAQPAAGAIPDVAKMVGTLAAKLEANPDNPEGWAMLGRSYKVLGRYSESAAAFARIGPKLEQNAGWLAEYADVLAMEAGGQIAGRPAELAEKALKLEPDNLLALMLAGSAAAGRKDYAKATEYLQRALPLVEPNSEDSRFLEDALNKLREQSGAAPVAAAVETAPAAPAAAAKPVLSVRVELAAALKSEVPPGATLFVIARAPGERMPIAALKRSADTLPGSFELDDSASLRADRPLSGIPTVELEARVSASGNAAAAPGDLLGTAGPVKTGSQPVQIRIDHKRE